LSRQYQKNIGTNATHITRPAHGCSVRDHTPPPRKLLRNQNAGWNSARPLSVAMMKLIASTQWVERSSAL